MTVTFQRIHRILPMVCMIVRIGVMTFKLESMMCRRGTPKRVAMHKGQKLLI